MFFRKIFIYTHENLLYSYYIKLFMVNVWLFVLIVVIILLGLWISAAILRYFYVKLGSANAVMEEKVEQLRTIAEENPKPSESVPYLTQESMISMLNENLTRQKEIKKETEQIISLAIETVFKEKDNLIKELLNEITKHVHTVISDEQLAKDLIENLVKNASKHFASMKSAGKRESQVFDKEVVRSLVGQNPGLFTALKELGLMELLEKKPHLVFYVLSNYPQLLNIGSGSPPGEPPPGQPESPAQAQLPMEISEHLNQ